MALSLSKGQFIAFFLIFIYCRIADKEIMPAWLYILRLKSGQLYAGSTIDLDRRIGEHYSGHACRTTKLDPPIAVAYTEELKTFVEARRREAQIKRWSRAKKEALIAGNLDELRRLSNPCKNV